MAFESLHTEGLEILDVPSASMAAATVLIKWLFEAGTLTIPDKLDG